MTKNKTELLFWAWVLGLTLSSGVGFAKEPISAPAEFGSIPSPKITAKTERSQNQDLLKLVEEAIEISGRRFLIANEHSPWQIYHGLNALRRDFQLELNGELVPAIDWISASNPKFRDTPWFERTIHGGRAHRYTVPYHFEGHPNQSLALMVMCNLPVDHQFAVDGGTITVADVINNAKVDLNPAEEQTWTLWFLTHYLTADETWKTRRGDIWSLERLVQDQVATQVTKAACGGTHNLYALSVARNNYVRQGGQIRGVWMQADQKVKRYMVAARSLQKADGSFPTQYFRGYGSPKTFSEQIASTGHMMEWLMVAVDDRQLSEEWVERGIRYIAQKLIDNRNESAECGPLYHAVAALSLYRDRLRGIPWPNPRIQPETPAVSPVPNLVDTPLPQTPPQTARLPQINSLNDSASLPAPSETKIEINPLPNSVSDQSAQGKMSVGIDDTEMDLKFELPTKTATTESEVEMLAAPEKETQTR